MKARADVELAAGRAELHAAGLGEGETSPAVLMPLSGRSPALDQAIVERLAREPSDDRAAALRALATGAEPRGWKAVVKEARRALYRFAQRGITIPTAPEPAAPAHRAPTSGLEGYLSMIDGRGDRLLWLVRPQREGGLLVLTGIVNEPAGLREIALAELSRKTLKRMQQDLRTRHGLRMVAADGDFCDALLAEAYERGRARETAGIGDYPTYRARMVTRPPGSPTPPLIHRALSPTECASPEALQHGPALLAEAELATWLIERPALQPYLDEIAAARESPLLLSRPQQEERVERIITRALRELFEGGTGAAWRRRLEETAYYLHATGRRELAVAAAATAHALATSTTGGQGVPLLEALVRRSFAALVNEDAARAESEARGSVLVKPSAALPRHPRPDRAR